MPHAIHARGQREGARRDATLRCVERGIDRLLPSNLAPLTRAYSLTSLFDSGAVALMFCFVSSARLLSLSPLSSRLSPARACCSLCSPCLCLVSPDKNGRSVGSSCGVVSSTTSRMPAIATRKVGSTSCTPRFSYQMAVGGRGRAAWALELPGQKDTNICLSS